MSSIPGAVVPYIFLFLPYNLSYFKDFLNYCKNYVYVCVYVYEYRSLWRPEVLDSLKLGEAPNTGAGNQTLVFCKNSISSYYPVFPSPDLISVLNYHCLVSTIASATSFTCVTLADSQKPQTQQTLQMRKCGARGHSVTATQFHQMLSPSTSLSTEDKGTLLTPERKADCFMSPVHLP